MINYAIVPTTNAFSTSLINVSQGQLILNQIRATGFVPPNQPISPTSPSTVNPSSNAPALALLNLLNLFNFSANQQSRLFEDLGTRVATDYTPFTRYPWRPIQYPLEGNVAVNRLAAAAAGQAVFGLTAFNANEVTALNQQGVVVGPATKDNYLDLIRGYVLFMPKGNINVQTREGNVAIPKGAVAWVMETGHDVAIYDLHDNLATGYIKVNVNNKVLTLSPGTQLLLTRNNEEDFESLNPGYEIGYLNVQKRDMGDGIYAYVCRFPIASAISNVRIIHDLLASNDPAEKTTAMAMIKNAAILDDLTGYPEYKYGSLIAGKGEPNPSSLAGTKSNNL